MKIKTQHINMCLMWLSSGKIIILNMYLEKYLKIIPYPNGIPYINKSILKVELHWKSGITYPNIYKGPMLLQKVSRNSPSFCEICFFSNISAIIFAPMGNPHKNPIKITYSIEEGRWKIVPKNGCNNLPNFIDIPLRIMKPDKIIKGNSEGIMFWNQIKRPLEAKVVHSLE